MIIHELVVFLVHTKVVLTGDLLDIKIVRQQHTVFTVQLVMQVEQDTCQQEKQLELVEVSSVI